MKDGRLPKIVLIGQVNEKLVVPVGVGECKENETPWEGLKRKVLNK